MKKLRLENEDDPTDMTSRIIDLICPIGKGQRGLIVSPPKAGKTTVMKTIATSIERNNRGSLDRSVDRRTSGRSH